MKPQFSLDTIILSIIFVAGLLFVFLPPPFQKADEFAHFRRSIMLSHGIVSCTTDKKTVNVRKDIYDLFFEKDIRKSISEKTKLNVPRYLNKITSTQKNNKQEKIEVGDLCTYPVVSYIPQSATLFLFSLTPFNSYMLFFLGRLAVFLTCFIVFIFLFKRTPKPFNYVILVVFSLPMALHQMTSYSYDAIQFISLLGYFSFLVRLLKAKHISIKDILFAEGLFFLFLFSKPGGYEFLALTLFLIPCRHIYPRKPLYGFLVLSGITCICFVLYFLIRLSLYQYVSAMAFRPGIDPFFQLKLLMQPIFFVPLILKTSFHHAWFYYKGLIGIFGWLEYGMNVVVYPLYLFLFIFLLNMKSSLTLDRMQKIILLISIGSTYIFLISINYLFWTTKGSSIADGVQGRYFIPLVPFLLLFLYGFIKKPFVPEKTVQRYTPLCILMISIYLVFSAGAAIMGRYF